MDAEPSISLPSIREALASVTQVVGCVKTLSAQDSGLFGPASVSWRIFRHPAYAVSAIAGLLLEALHPVAMAAIDQHSDYRRNAWRRAHRTTDYVFTITFSDTPTALQAAERVRLIHRKIAGVDPGSGRTYRADDPDLLLWIHCVNTDMALRGHEAFAGGLGAADADRFVLEQVRAAELVGLPREAVPSDRRQLGAYLSAALQEIALSPPAKEFAELLLRARMPWTMRGFWALHVAGAVMLLPPPAERIYRFPRWLPRGRAARASIRAVLRLMDWSYAAFPSIRAARRKLREIRNEAKPAG